jgi:hypothetical protein
MNRPVGSVLAYDSLVDFAAGLGHRDFPLLSTRYSPASCVPCRDFSPWLRERLRKSDRDALIEYVWRIRAANPGVGFGDDPKTIARIFAPQVHRVVDAPLERYIGSADPVALEDLRTALIMLAPLDGFSGFTMAQKVPHYLAAVMFCRVVHFQHMTELRDRATAFVTEMTKDTPFWDGWSLPDPTVLEVIQPPGAPEDEGLRRELARLPLGARAHAVDVLLLATNQASETTLPIAFALEGATTYVTRQFGCDPAESALALLASGVFVPPEDPAAYLRGLARRELVELGTLKGVAIKKSWAKEKLGATIAAAHPEAAPAAMVGHQVGMVTPMFAAPATRVCGTLEAAIPAWSLVASFAIPESNLKLA